MFLEVVYRPEIGIPDGGHVLLVGGGGVAIIHVDQRVRGGGQAGNVDPGDEGAIGIGVGFNFVGQFVGAVGGGEKDIVAVGLGVGGEIAVDLADEHGEIRQVAGDIGVINGDELAVEPGVVVPGNWSEGDGRGVSDRDSVRGVRGCVSDGFGDRITYREGHDTAVVGSSAGG